MNKATSPTAEKKMTVASSKEVGSFIKARRKYLKVTQKELSELTGLSVDGIGRIEKGQRSVSMVSLVAISEILGFQINLRPEEISNDENRNP